ncbi:pentalenene synthase [Streptomyces sp. NPDC052179]|uniref:terpene synthase family protein n=1 Tax=Streptomyces sp. NPDC052179 TaxID=3155680 RepID=UPI0034381F79
MPQGVDTYIPFPRRVSPDAGRATAGHLVWPSSFGLLRGPDAVQRHARGAYPELAGRFHPSATGADLGLGVDQQSWFFLFDDAFDGSMGQDRERAKKLVHAVAEVLEAPSPLPPTRAAPPLALAFADLWERSREGMSASWQARAAANWHAYLAGHVTEAANRSGGAGPSSTGHVTLRRDTCGVPPILDLAERLGHFEIAERAYRSSLVTTLRLLAAEVVTLDNEIISLEKEEALGDNNLVLIIEREEHCSRTESIALICDMIRARTERFLALERQLPQLCDSLGLDEAERASQRRYQDDALRTVMRGAHDWQQHCSRYAS